MATASAPVRLVSAAWVLPMTAPPIPDGAVLLDADDVIVSVGPRAALSPARSTLPETRAAGFLMPGLVNSHTHLELSALSAGVPGGDGLVGWVGRLLPMAQALSRSSKENAARLAVSSLRAAGTAAIADVCNELGCVAALRGSGLVGVVFHEMLGSREQRTGDALADGHKELERLLAADGDGWPQGFSYVPAAHAPYSVSPALLRRIFDEARRLGQASSIHVAEDADELALLRDGSGPWAAILARMGVKEGERTSGLSPVAHLAAAGAFESSHPPLLVHMVHASAEDRRIAAAAHAPAVLCPRSNLHVGGRLPDVPALLRDGVVLALGTDSLASSPDLSLWGEMEALAAAFPNVAPEVWLAAATTGGANALGLADHGALAPGKRPGLLDVSGGDLGADAATVYHRLVAVHPRSCRFLSRAVATPSRSPARLS